MNRLSLPESLAEFVEREAAEGGYESAEGYILHLVEAEQKRKARERLEAMMDEGRNSGEAVEATPKWWTELRDDVIRDSRA